MKRWIGPLLVLVVAALLAHGLTLALGPGVIMDRAMAALEARGVALHAFTTPQRVTPQTQSVVRSSPDLHYALCRYDLTRPDGDGAGVITSLHLKLAAWPAYQSLSFFDARTNNFATVRATGKSIKVQLGSGPGQTGFLQPKFGYDPREDGPTLAIHTPTDTGVILIRRLAPSPEAFAKAVKASVGDACDFRIEPSKAY
jgi:uncharacterized membrane protein